MHRTGDPQITETANDREATQRSKSVRPERYDWNQTKTTSAIPKLGP